jgi:uncharacterized coiled-coil protein SlyX
MPNAIGDLAFPDNPKRRKRAGELHDDIVGFGAEFQKLHNQRYALPFSLSVQDLSHLSDWITRRAQMVARLKPKVDALLQKFQITSPEQLEMRINSALNSEQMMQYRELKSKQVIGLS